MCIEDIRNHMYTSGSTRAVNHSELMGMLAAIRKIDFRRNSIIFLKDLCRVSVKLTDWKLGVGENPMPIHPSAGPNMPKVMFLPVTVQDTVQGVPSNV